MRPVVGSPHRRQGSAGGDAGRGARHRRAGRGRSPAHANGTVDAFVNRWNGSYADYDGAYGAQCVDLFNYYNRDVVKAPRIAVNYAAQLFGAAPSSHYELSPGVTPQR